MKRSALDPARRVDLYFRVNRDASKTFVVVDGDGADYLLIYLDFQLFIKKNAGAKQNIISLTVNNGLTILNLNEIVATFTDTQTNIDPGEYYWELYLPDSDKTWLCGKAIFHNGIFDGIDGD